jgi:hypothetical protein
MARLIVSLPAVVLKPRVHRARGRSHGLGSQDVWATRHILEHERGWRRRYSGQILFISCTHMNSVCFLVCLD